MTKHPHFHWIWTDDVRKLETAAAGSDYLDNMIQRAIGAPPKPAPSYTRSIDAALGLIPEGWALYQLGRSHDVKMNFTHWHAQLYREKTSLFEARLLHGETAALAICAAALLIRGLTRPREPPPAPSQAPLHRALAVLAKIGARLYRRADGTGVAVVPAQPPAQHGFRRAAISAETTAYLFAAGYVDVAGALTTDGKRYLNGCDDGDQRVPIAGNHAVEHGEARRDIPDRATASGCGMRADNGAEIRPAGTLQGQRAQDAPGYRDAPGDAYAEAAAIGD